MLDPANAKQPFPVVLTGPRSSAVYFEQITKFLIGTLGQTAAARLRVVIDDPAEVARIMDRGVDEVREYRRLHGDSYNYNWLLHVSAELQRPFVVDHAAMSTLQLHQDQPAYKFAADLRRAFSGIVTGNVKENGVRMIEKHGPFQLVGDPLVMDMLDSLLAAFVVQHRMKLPGPAYVPCYRIVKQ